MSVAYIHVNIIYIYIYTYIHTYIHTYSGAGSTGGLDLRDAPQGPSTNTSSVNFLPSSLLAKRQAFCMDV